MIVVGLTGSIGMGKTETARNFKRLGVPVFDSDAEVHRLTKPGGAALAAIRVVFPGVITGDFLDREKLGETVFADDSRRQQLENILHPMVRIAQRRFLLSRARRGVKAALIDVPLLFESGLEQLFDQVITVSASPEIQRQRVLARPGMTAKKFERILSSQLPDSEKKERADIVIDTDRGRRPVYAQARRLLRSWEDKKGGLPA